jgi:hypothetical protein
MAEQITLEQVVQGIGDLGAIIQAGFAYNETKFSEMEIRFAAIEKHMAEGFKAVRDRLDTVEYGMRQIQKDFVSLDEEIRGIHKVIDHLNIRVMALERNFGATPLFPVG